MAGVMNFIFFLFFAFQAAVSSAADFPAGKLRSLAGQKAWQRLLHYQKHWLGADSSSEDGADFFLSTAGKNDPYAEISETFREFENPSRRIGKLGQSAYCAFPARREFLERELGLRFPPVPCPEFADYMSRFRDPQSVTLVYSSAYPNNPASMFGHSFLRINNGGDKLDLLDMGLSYAAQVPEDENPFVFAFKGLTGGYAGEFSLMPYHSKVNEYNNSESRDLWEYDLALSPAETRQLLAHVWELKMSGGFDYYFFDENCSYAILRLLEAVKPDWELSSYAIHVIPGETVKRLTAQEGAVRGVKFRPSLYKKMMARAEALSGGERRVFQALIGGEDVYAADARTLEALAYYYNYKRQESEGVLPEREEARWRKILLARSRSTEAAAGEPEYKKDSRPDLGHFADRISLGYGGGGSRGFTQLGFKFAYHDLLNHDEGYVPFSEINFPNFDLRYRPGKFWLSRLEFLSIVNLSPWNAVKNSLSWKAKLAYSVPRDLCSECRVWHLDGGLGYSWSHFKDEARTYAMLSMLAEAGSSVERSWRLAPGLSFGFIANLSFFWKILLEAEIARDFVSPGTVYAGKAGQSFFLSRAFEIRVTGKGVKRVEDNAAQRGELLGELLYYF